MGYRIVLLVTSPRMPAGLLTAQGWDLVRAHPVVTAAENDQVAALRASGVAVTVVEPTAAVVLAEAARHGTVVWLSGPAGDESLTRELGLRLAREPGLAELELVYGSWDPPGARLLDAVAVVDRLAAPDGDAWLGRYVASPAARAELPQYLLEEAYEAYDALRSGDAAAAREELGDLVFQVILHARLAEEAPVGEALDAAADDAASDDETVDDEAAPRFTIDDVAGDLVGKLVRRNPHVFGGVAVTDVEEITRNWERIKRAEKSRDSAMDGIALSQPALALAAKVLARIERSGVGQVSGVPVDAGAAEDVAASPVTEAELGAGLFALVARARAAGIDAEGALRRVVVDAIEAVRRAETAGGT